ncbi:MAG: LptA/OstA family protein, partial [Nitrospiria bacterium]
MLRRAPFLHSTGAALLLCAASGASVATAQPADLKSFGPLKHSIETFDVPVEISADRMSYSREQDVLTAVGRLHVSQGTLSLDAERAELHRSTGRMLISGGITARDGDDTIKAEAMNLDLKTRTGVLTQGRLFLPRDHYHVSGDRIERLADQRYRLEGAVLTTCDWDEAKG